MRRVTAALATAVILAVSVFHVIRATEASEATEAEGFEQLTAVDMSVARSPKSLRYNRAALKFFYSDGADAGLVTADALFFNPTVNDVVCTLANSRIAATCDAGMDRIDFVSCADTTTPFDALGSCTSQSTRMSSAPDAPSDCGLRVLDRYYRLAKSCLVLRAEYFESRGTKGLLLATDSPATVTLVLSRPMFFAAPDSHLCAVSYTHVPGVANQLCDFDSASGGKTLMPFDGTSALDQRTRTLSESMRNLKSAVYRPAAEATRVYTTIYYLNYDAHAQASVPAPEKPAFQVLTLYFDLKGPPVLTQPLPLFSTPALSVAIDGATVSAKTKAGKVSSIEVFPSSLLVVTYATNLIIMCCVSNTRVRIKHFPGQDILTITDSVRAEAKAAAAAPARLFPHDNACIPNFADLALKSGFRLGVDVYKS